jgi:hypothetical protein
VAPLTCKEYTAERVTIQNSGRPPILHFKKIDILTVSILLTQKKPTVQLLLLNIIALVPLSNASLFIRFYRFEHDLPLYSSADGIMETRLLPKRTPFYH